MYCKLVREGEEIKESKFEEIYLITCRILFVISMAGMIITDRLESNLLFWFLGLYLTILLLQFVVTCVRILKYRRGYWYIGYSVIFYAALVGEFFLLYDHLESLGRTLFYVIVTGLFFDLGTTKIQKLMEKQKSTSGQ